MGLEGTVEQDGREGRYRLSSTSRSWAVQDPIRCRATPIQAEPGRRRQRQVPPTQRATASRHNGQASLTKPSIIKAEVPIRTSSRHAAADGHARTMVAQEAGVEEAPPLPARCRQICRIHSVESLDTGCGSSRVT
jgi:hypothetical protein